MKLISSLHIAVVRDSDQGLVFGAHLRRMGVGRVMTIASLHTARILCWAGGVDAFIVVMGNEALEARAAKQDDAPGHGCGVNTLMMVARASTGLRKLAREAGHDAIVPASTAPRMLCRRVRAILQGRRAGGPARTRLSAVMTIAPYKRERPVIPGEPTLH